MTAAELIRAGLTEILKHAALFFSRHNKGLYHPLVLSKTIRLGRLTLTALARCLAFLLPSFSSCAEGNLMVPNSSAYLADWISMVELE